MARNVRAYGKPAFCNESGREIRHLNDDPVHRRKQAWFWCVLGGFRTWHSWDGCEGIDEISYQSPGSQYLRPMSDFFRSLPFWELTLNFTLLAPTGSDLITAMLATPDRNLAVGYLCTSASGVGMSPSPVAMRLPQGSYSITWLDPKDLSVQASQMIAIEHDAQVPVEIELPHFVENLLIRVERVSQS